jgi:hypothetical protein
MATSQTMLLCEAIATWADGIAAGSWAARSTPNIDLQNLTSRVQFVWPFAREVELQTRGGGKEVRPEFALAIAQRLPPPPADPEVQFDLELKRMEDLADEILGETLTFGSKSATFVSARHEPLYDRTFLEQHRVIACAVVVGALVHFDPS